jgi:hypothetical protein
MAENTVTNWFGDLVSHPQQIVEANGVADIIAVMKNPDKYPSPVRAVGSNHSTTPCGVAEGGTLIKMKMNRILNIGKDTVTVEAGALYIDIALELEKHNLQVFVNTEIGCLSAGSAACCGTKDSSMPGEFGQVSSYAIGVKMVLPSGELLEVTENDKELLQKVRCSYGTFGIVYEVTFRVRPLARLDVHHKTYSVQDFITALPELRKLDYALMYYIFPFNDRITVEFRRYNPTAKGDPDTNVWKVRNYFWGTVGPKFAHDTEQNVADPSSRYAIIDAFSAMWRFKLENIIHSDNTLPSGQMIRYPPVSDDSRYTFSLFAFPEAEFPKAFTGYVKFVNDYYKNQHYRSNLLSVGYRITQDQSSLLSYSYDGAIMTIDPISTNNDGWKTFLTAYNGFCSDLGGIPLLNQTYGLTPAIIQKAFGARLSVIKEARKNYDPQGRLLNPYFQTLLT